MKTLYLLLFIFQIINSSKISKRQIQNGCASSPCLNDGLCVLNLDGSYQCYCTQGFAGPTCEIEINECASSPCKNAGTCLDLKDAFLCQCQSGYAGVFCEVVLVTTTALTTAVTTTTVSGILCPFQSPCQNQGLCIFFGTTYQCICPEGYSGSLCEILFTTTSITTTTLSTSQYCTSTTCKNGGTCVSGTNGAFERCDCRNGFNGKYCQYCSSMN
jgi:sushi, von Willebrand factor type A, EGF and pentraxin domain-containing protein 1